MLNQNKVDWKRKFTSRKLWLSVASFVSMMMIYFGKAESDASQVAALIMAGATIIGYVIGEGLADSGHDTDTLYIQDGVVETDE